MTAAPRLPAPGMDDRRRIGAGDSNPTPITSSGNRKTTDPGTHISMAAAP